MDNPTPFGTLFVVATPIGNLEDMTFRAIDVLKQVDLIAAEDTRHSKKLVSHYGIKTKLVSCHEHNEADKTPKLITHLKNGLDIALISDAGTPCISDPGYTLVSAAAKEQINIIPIPGCNAAMAGLSVSGLPTDSFLFLGFLSKKQQKLRQDLEALKHQGATLIFYESPKRIKRLIENMIDILEDRNACLVREATKLHEEYIRGTLTEILQKLDKKETIKGECSLFVHGCTKTEIIDNDELEKIILIRMNDDDFSTSVLARQISNEYKLPKKKVYETILKLQNGKKDIKGT